MGLWKTYARRTGVALASGAVLLVGGVGGRFQPAGWLPSAWRASDPVRDSRTPARRVGPAAASAAAPPGRAGLVLLAGRAVVGLAGCSVLLIMATRAASPAEVGVVIGAAPLIITIAGPVAPAAGRLAGCLPPRA